MTVTINGSGTMTGLAVGGLNDNIITKNEMATGGAWAPAGTVLQVVQGSTSTPAASSSTSFADTGLTATITPTSATSKILVLISHVDCWKSSGNANNALGFLLVKNGVSVVQFAGDALFTGTANTNYGNVGFNYLDSPATTSALTYKTQFKNSEGSFASVNVQGNALTSTIVLMEIAA